MHGLPLPRPTPSLSQLEESIDSVGEGHRRILNQHGRTICSGATLTHHASTHPFVSSSQPHPTEQTTHLLATECTSIHAMPPLICTTTGAGGGGWCGCSDTSKICGGGGGRWRGALVGRLSAIPPSAPHIATSSTTWRKGVTNTYRGVGKPPIWELTHLVFVNAFRLLTFGSC